MIHKDKEITIDEAINIMKQTRVKVASGNVNSYKAARNVLIKAAGHRIPEKPLNRSEGEVNYIAGNCPSCGSLVDEIDDENFCHVCGQKLSWNEE